MASKRAQAAAKTADVAAEAKTEQVKAKVLVVSEALAPFNTGDTLSKKEHIIQHIRNMLNEDQPQDKLTGLNDAQLWAVFQATSLDNMSAEDAELALVAAAQQVETSTDTPLIDMSEVSALFSDALTTAVEMGQKMDDAGEAFINETLDAGKTWDSSPIVFAENHLKRVYSADDRSQWPIMRSRRRADPKKDTRGDGNTISTSDYEKWQQDNTPVDLGHTWDNTKAKNVNWRWLDAFVDSFPHRRAFTEKLRWLKLLVDNNGATTPAMPDDVKELEDKPVLAQTTLEDMLTDRRNYINRVETSIRYLQRCEAIEDMFTKVRVKLAVQWANPDATVESAARSSKPIMLIAVEQSTDPVTKVVKEKESAGKGITVTKFLNMKLGVALQQGGRVVDLMNSTNRGTKKKGPAASEQGATAPLDRKVPNATRLVDYCDTVQQYLDSEGAESNIRRAILDPKNGGMLAYSIVALHDNLVKFGTNADIRKIADAYNAAQTGATAAAMAGANALAPENLPTDAKGIPVPKAKAAA